jgi:Ca2+:H+ antiporter
LNATFGNAAELIIAIVALHDGHIGLVKASITGSILGNLLLVLGLSFFLGGSAGNRRPFTEPPRRTRRRCCSSPSWRSSCRPCSICRFTAVWPASVAIDRLSLWSALIMISAYAGSLIYAFTTQRDLFRPDEHATAIIR